MSVLGKDFVERVQPDEAETEAIDVELPRREGENERAGEEETEGGIVADASVLGVAVGEVDGSSGGGTGGVGRGSVGGHEAHCEGGGVGN